MTLDWTVTQILDYMRTWSASQRYLQANGTDPTVPFKDELAAAWGETERIVTWPLTLLLGRK